MNYNKLSQEEIEIIRESCLDDSTKIIRYLEEKEHKNRKRDIANLILTIIAAVCGIISILPDIIELFTA